MSGFVPGVVLRSFAVFIHISSYAEPLVLDALYSLPNMVRLSVRIIVIDSR